VEGVNTIGSSGSSVSVFVTLTAFIDNVLSLIWRLKNEQELRISILFSVIVVYNLFSSLKYTILLLICYLKVIDE
jgi:hypothetical protein